ncbi:MAG: hypothetical protein K9L64_05370 [Candidatus Izimaplasma sp.]|nr:hypothetical protein [Candidatus Izimaplasma bacterium]
MNKNRKLAQRVVYASKATKLSKVARFGIIVTAMLTFLIFAISFYGLQSGNFTFTVDEKARQAGITLYENPVERDFTARLVAEQVDNADGMTTFCGTEYSDRPIGHKDCIPPDEEITSVNGSNNGESYIAYTFYVTMVSNSNYIGDLVASVDFISTSRSAEEALRVKVIINDEPITYAKRQSEKGSNPGELELLTDEPFYNANTVMRRTYNEFRPGEVLKVTLIVWYEGYDADHTVNLWSGGVKLEMNFTLENTQLLED